MKELIILGHGPSRRDCPFDTEVWASVSMLSYDEFKDRDYSKVFIFDRPETLKTEYEGIRVAQERGLTIVSYFDGIATEPYPLDALREHFNTDYFRNDASYMLALAIYNGYERLRLYGIDQGPEWDYLATKPYTTFWLGVATGKGVLYEQANTSLLMQNFDGEIKEHIEEEKKVAVRRFKVDILPHMKTNGVLSIG